VAGRDLLFFHSMEILCFRGGRVEAGCDGKRSYVLLSSLSSSPFSLADPEAHPRVLPRRTEGLPVGGRATGCSKTSSCARSCLGGGEGVEVLLALLLCLLELTHQLGGGDGALGDADVWLVVANNST
jgi:hypothetical protein